VFVPARTSMIAAVLALAMAAAGVSPADPPGAAADFPVARGNCWVYRGIARTGPVEYLDETKGERVRVEGENGSPVSCEVEVRVEITGIEELAEGSRLAWATRTTTPLDPCPYPPLVFRADAPQDFAYLIDGNRVWDLGVGPMERIRDHDGRLTATLQQLRELATDLSPFLVLPLRDGLRYTNSRSPLREDGYYQWVVSKAPAEVLLGKPRNEIYLLRYKSLPSTTELWFVPGLGVVRDKSSHHGSVDEWDLRLVDRHLAAADVQAADDAH